jgi:hypothetical protein
MSLIGFKGCLSSGVLAQGCIWLHAVFGAMWLDRQLPHDCVTMLDTASVVFDKLHATQELTGAVLYMVLIRR